MSGGVHKSKPVELDCGCVRWFNTNQMPDINEPVWCPKHQRTELPGPAEARHGRTLQDDFWSEPYKWNHGIRYRGGCLHDECTYEDTEPNWFLLRDDMHHHYMKQHTRFHSDTTFEKASKLPPGSEPPF